MSADQTAHRNLIGRDARRPIPKEVLLGQEELSTDDLDNIVHCAVLPDEEWWDQELDWWANSDAVESAIRKPGEQMPLYQFIRRGNVYSKSAMPLHFHRNVDSPEDSGIDRGHLCHLAGCIQRLFEPPLDDYESLVGIEYGEELNPIDGSMSSRQYCQVSFDEIISGRLRNLAGKVENVRFTGVVKSERFEGLLIPVQIGLFSASGRDEHWEPLGDRATRMLHQCSQSHYMTAARNLNSMLNKPKLINEFNADRKSFPNIKTVHQLSKKVDATKAAIRPELARYGKLALLCSMLESAISARMHDELDTYCESHFRVRGMSRDVVEKFIVLAHRCMNDHGQIILASARYTLQEILPFKVSTVIMRCIDGMLPSERWKYVSSVGSHAWRPGIKLVEVTGPEEIEPEEIELVNFKRTSIRPLLKNIGLVVVDEDCEMDITAAKYSDAHLSSLNISWSRHLTQDQSSIRSIASQMNFATTTRPFPFPSLSPEFAKGALVFVNAAVTRDLEEMIRECEQRGHRIGFGMMFCSKAMTDLVMKVLDPKRAMQDSGDFIRTKSTAYTKVDSKVVIELPQRLSFSSRKFMSEEARKQTAPNFLSDPGLGASHAPSDLCSLDTRPTRTTGDLPLRPTENRPNECDRPHRQPLKGHIRGDTFFSNSSKVRLDTTGKKETKDWCEQGSYDRTAGSSTDATWSSTDATWNTDTSWWTTGASWWSGWSGSGWWQASNRTPQTASSTGQADDTESRVAQQNFSSRGRGKGKGRGRGKK